MDSFENPVSDEAENGQNPPTSTGTPPLNSRASSRSSCTPILTVKSVLCTSSVSRVASTEVEGATAMEVESRSESGGDGKVGRKLKAGKKVGGTIAKKAAGAAGAAAAAAQEQAKAAGGTPLAGKVQGLNKLSGLNGARRLPSLPPWFRWLSAFTSFISLL